MSTLSEMKHCRVILVYALMCIQQLYLVIMLGGNNENQMNDDVSTD